MTKRSGSSHVKKLTGEELNKTMTKLGMSPEFLAKISGVEEDTVMSWVSGKAPVDDDVAETLAAFEKLNDKPEGKDIIESIYSIECLDNVNILPGNIGGIVSGSCISGGTSGIGNFIKNIAMGAITIGGAMLFLNKFKTGPAKPDDKK